MEELSKKEFQVLAMLYAANCDGNIETDEVGVMLEKADSATYHKIYKMFMKMNDIEVLTCIKMHRDKYAATPEDRQTLMDEIMAVINADDKVVGFEHYLPKMLEKILR